MFLLFLAIAMAYGIRINLSVALVSMTNFNRTDGYEVREHHVTQLVPIEFLLGKGPLLGPDLNHRAIMATLSLFTVSNK